jgi:hypothetical protein
MKESESVKEKEKKIIKKNKKREKRMGRKEIIKIIIKA